MASDIYRKLYRKLLALYPSEFRERLGESMEQTFDDLTRERKDVAAMFFNTGTGIVREHVLQFTRTTAMRDPTRNTAILSALLCLPSITFFSLLILNIEPPFAAMLREEPDKPNVIGSLIALFIFLLLPLALFVSLRPIVSNFRAGNGLAASPANLLVALVSFGYLAFVVINIIVDQYPCWMGVPNCD
jgi:hypothetical protein